MKHLNYQTETFTLHVEVQDQLSQADKDLITVLFKTLVEETTTKEVSTTKYGRTTITVKDIHAQVLKTIIDKGLKVSCKNGDCRVPKTVDEIPPNLLKKSSDSYKKARAKLYYKLKKEQALWLQD